MAYHNGPKTVLNGLICHLDGANIRSYPKSGTTWFDLTGNANDGELVNNPTFNNGNLGNLVFSGVNNYVAVANATATGQWTPSGGGLNNITIELWIKSSDTAGGFYISRPWNGNGEYNYYAYSGAIVLTIGNQSYTLGVASFEDNNWHQVVYWISPTQVGYYIDGNRLLGSGNHGITNNTPSFGNSGLRLTLMTLFPYGSGWGGDVGHAVAGNLAITKIYNRVLTSVEVLQNFNANRGRFGI